MNSGAGGDSDSGFPGWFVRLAQLRAPLQVMADAVAWGIAVWAATLLRYDFDLPANSVRGIATMVVTATVVYAAVGLTHGLYLRRWRYGSFDEMSAVVRSTAITMVVVSVLNRAWYDTAIPTSSAAAAGVGALVAMAAVRFAWRVVLDRLSRPVHHEASRVLVFGAGEAGQQLVRQMVSDPNGTYVPVAMLDDDPAKANFEVRKVPVVGTRYDLVAAVEALDVSMLIIAEPSASGDVVRVLAEAAEALGLEVRVLPSVTELIGGVALSLVRPVTEEDLMGRGGITIDLESISHHLTGKRILVTGAGGSIGSELCRQMQCFNPAQLVMVDRDEGGLHGVQMSIEGSALLDDPCLVVADIRDRERMAEVFGCFRPQVVFHAAALKHLSLLEMHPGEAVKTNIWGTQNLLELAAEHGVERFVNISTDKAADPISVLGSTKRIAERLTARAARDARGVFVSVRFGNVLGSRGSVLETFQAQIAAGVPVTVTHPEVTRYFMTTGEAVALVIQAGAIGERGEALVLDMGQPVSIDSVARRLIARADPPVDIVYTGLRPGEKLHEVLLAHGEQDRRSVHPLISHVEVPVLDPTRVAEFLAACGGDGGGLIDRLLTLCEFSGEVVSQDLS